MHLTDRDDTTDLVPVCFLAGARYGRPLDPTSEKKYRALKRVARLFIIGFSKTWRPCRFAEHAEFYLLPRLPMHWLRYVELLTLGPLIALWLVLRRDVRILVAQSPYEGFAGTAVKRIAGWLGVPVALIVEDHGDFEEGLFLQRRVLFPRVYRFLMRRTAASSLRAADIFRTVSEYTTRQILRRASGKPVHQFLAWTDIDVFLDGAGQTRIAQADDIVYAGVLIPLKGIHHLLNAFRRISTDFPRARLVVIGRAEHKEYSAELKTKAQELGLGDRVVFTGEIPQAELAARMRGAKVFVLPSYSEGLPRVIVEAMVAGLPVIASRVGGIPEILQEGVHGFLTKPGDEPMLADRLRWMLEHENEAREMGRRARQTGEQLFSTEGYVRDYERMFQDALRRAAPGPVPSTT
jgi:glycosyltransferase involved in cell wall biosynthesis